MLVACGACGGVLESALGFLTLGATGLGVLWLGVARRLHGLRERLRGSR